MNWPKQLISDIARRRCVLYLGAGISANARARDGRTPPTWEQFLRSCLKNIDKNERDYIELLLKRKDYLSACEVIIDRIGFSAFKDEAQNAFRQPGYKPAEIHEIIFGLDSRLIITPNVDKIYDQYANSMSQGTVVEKRQTDNDLADFIRRQERVIIKAHGSIDAPDNMIFSLRQYNEARYKYAGFYRILDSLTLTHTFIFIGCGLNDPDIMLTMQNYNFNFPNCRPHYFICADNEINRDIENSLLNNYNIKVLKYDNSCEDYHNLPIALNELRSQVESERNNLADNYNW